MSYRDALKNGTLLTGDYRIEDVLGAGGFGITYRATDLRLNSDVAIKEYFPGEFALREDTQRVSSRAASRDDDYQWGLKSFLNEAQTLARFRHNNIVRVSRVFEDNNTAYMVLDLEHGKSFKAWLKDLGRPPTQEELDDLLPPLLNALETIHENKFLHRDIAPDNFYVRNDGTPVLLDFGSARQAIGAHSQALSAVIKSGYSPVEQYAANAQQGAWTDIYALGATLYYGITGEVLQESTSRLLEDSVEPLETSVSGEYRKSFLAALDHAIRPRPDDRPRTVEEWRKALFEKPQTNDAATQVKNATKASDAKTKVAGTKIEDTGQKAEPETTEAEEKPPAGDSADHRPSLWREWRFTFLHLGLFIAAYVIAANNALWDVDILVAEIYALFLLGTVLWQHVRYWRLGATEGDASGNRAMASSARVGAAAWISASCQIIQQAGNKDSIPAFLIFSGILALIAIRLTRRDDPWLTRLIFAMLCLAMAFLLTLLFEPNFWRDNIAHFTPPVLGATAVITLVTMVIALKRRTRSRRNQTMQSARTPGP